MEPSRTLSFQRDLRRCGPAVRPCSGGLMVEHVSAMTLPLNAVVVPSVAELPTCQ